MTDTNEEDPCDKKILIPYLFVKRGAVGIRIPIRSEAFDILNIRPLAEAIGKFTEFIYVR